jgi:hypothetical protein
LKKNPERRREGKEFEEKKTGRRNSEGAEREQDGRGSSEGKEGEGNKTKGE